MFNSNILEVAAGLVFVFLLLSLISSAANELIEAFMKKRASYLENGIRELVGSTDLETSKVFVQKIYEHGLINSLYRGDYKTAPKGELPSYIPARNFALAVIDIWQEKDQLPLPPNMQKAMDAFAKVAEGKAEVLRQEVENWYNSSMDRVSGWYKRRTQMIVLGLAVAITILVNADCISIAKRLSTDSHMREAALRLAENTAKQNASQAAAAQGAPAPTKSESDIALSEIKKNLDNLSGVGLPLGWDPPPTSLRDIGKAFTAHWIGWLITTLAVSLGAPFWFDVLNKIIVVRSTVKPAEKSGAEASKDAWPSSQKPMVLTLQTAGPALQEPSSPGDGAGGAGGGSGGGGSDAVDGGDSDGGGDGPQPGNKEGAGI